jgi:hypothetical protein
VRTAASDAEAESLTGRVNDCVARLATSDAAAVSVIVRGSETLAGAASDAEALSVAVRVWTTIRVAASLAFAVSVADWFAPEDCTATSEAGALSDAVRDSTTF